MTTIHHIYDKIFKKILTLSSTAVINLINGLFETDYPTDRRRSHFSTYTDNTILSKDSVQNSCELIFPEPKIIYLYSSRKIPDEYILYLNFGSQGCFPYKVTTFKFLETSTEELNARKLIILIPFQLLKLRSLLAKNRSYENLEALKSLIQNDIIGSIEKNLVQGNITMDDARKLKRLTHRLYQHIYSHYEEMEVLNDMTDESLMLDIDIIEKEHEAELMQKDQIISEKEKLICQIQAEKDAEIASLKAKLQSLKASN